ncbi:MAG: stage III sporulation protein AF [Bacillota bacterium]|nr:stage III sporulation protein AF [Bacillota bacterium]
MPAAVGNWVIQILVVAIVYALMDMLLPKGGLKNMAKVAIGLMVMLAILHPISEMVMGKGGVGSILDRENTKMQDTLTIKQKELEKSYEDWVWKVYVGDEKNIYENKKGNE